MNRYQREVAEFDRRHQLRLRALTFIGAAVVVILALWGSGWPPHRWWTTAGESNSTSAVATPPPSAQPETSLSVKAASPRAHALAGTDSSISPTPQPLYVVATSPGSKPSEGTARIGTNPKNPQTYVAGAILANDARLAEIHSDHVVLERQGRRLILYVSADASLAKRSQGFDELAMVGGARTAPAAARSAQKALTDVIRSMPVYENHALAGIKVFPGRDSAVFRQLGLQAGDLIVAIDAIPVADSHGASGALRMLIDSAVVTATVRRGQETKTVSLDGAVVAKALASGDTSINPALLAGPPPSP
jgi:hypothetical protein